MLFFIHMPQEVIKILGVIRIYEEVKEEKVFW